MHVFITGVAGFLGSNLADFYLNKNYKVSGNDTLLGGDIANVDKRVNFYKTNCENLDEMTKILKDVDVVCHTAAFAHEGLSVSSPTLIASNNVVGSTSVFTAAIKNKVKRIVYCSSMARYGNITYPFRENNETNPVDPYGVSKVAAENILKILCDVYDTEYNIAVPHNIIGPKQKYDDPFRNVASIMINLILQNRAPIIYGDGEQKRSFSDVDDCIQCLDKMMFDKNVVKQIINIGPDENFISINELFSLISNKLCYNGKPIYRKDRPNEVKFASCSSDKARKLLGYKTNVTLDDSIDKLIHYIKKNGTKKFVYNYMLELKNDNTPESWVKKEF